MSTYVISDIHGCYDEFQNMLHKIRLSDNDRLILAGDYIDRGPKSREMLQWLEKCPPNVVPIKGNHDAEFVEYVHLMQQTDQKNELMTDPDLNEDARLLLDSVRYQFKKKQPLGLFFFDYYNTITNLIEKQGVTFGELCRWAEYLDDLPLYERFECSRRECVVVHAGFCEDESVLEEGKKLNDFYLYAREEALRRGGIKGGTVIFGHTPTIIDDSDFFNDGKVYKYYNKEKDCVFYDIDCGCAFREMYPSANLACIRIEDEEVFYLYH